MELPSQGDFSAFLRAHTDELNRLYDEITNTANINAVISNVQGAQQNDAARKSRAQQLITSMRNYEAQLNTTLGAIQREQLSVSQFVKTGKNRVEVLRNEINEKRELANLRKEQASDVRQKYAADYHSSVLGLWRPLHPNTRGILYTVSTVLMLISIAAVGFLIYTRQRQISPAKTWASSLTTKGSGTQPPSSLFNDNDYGRVTGGGMKLRPKK
jgi:hypothetical protein